jgi:hypothetical protein
MSLWNLGKNLIGINKQGDLDAETSDQMSILKEENRGLKEKLNILIKENELLQQSVFNNETAAKTQFGKIFSGLKTAFLSNESLTGVNQSAVDFKSFLFDNLLYHSENIEEDDVEFLNNISITEDDWNKNKELYIFKQKLLTRNYQEMIRNILISNELNEFYKVSSTKVDKGTNNMSNNVTPTYVKQPEPIKNKYEDLLLGDNSLKDTRSSSVKEEKVSTVYVKTEKISIGKDTHSRQSVSSDKVLPEIKVNEKPVKEKADTDQTLFKQFIQNTQVAETKTPVKDTIINNITIDEEEDIDLSKIATKKIIPSQPKQSSTNDLPKQDSSNVLKKTVSFPAKKDSGGDNVDFFSSNELC